MRLRRPTKRVVITLIALALAVAGIAYAGYRYDIGIVEARQRIQSAPWWIFVAAMVALPPMGLPLSLFLVATGARFGLLYGSLIACGSIVAHHFIAVGVHRLFSDRGDPNEKAVGYWGLLEKKTGGNSSKLLLLWGLLPACPYSIKLYLPLSMGARPMQFARYSSIGHIVGAIAFVAFGQAVFSGPSLAVFIVIGFGILISIGFSVFRRRLGRPESAPS